jgi:pyruvate formate lyase activating enzyme
MEISGKPVVADEIMKEIEKETLVIDQSGGGVTFSGGEPLMHHEVLLELLIRCGELSIHRTVDTSLYADPDVVRKVMEHTDLFLVDLKHIDPEKHQACCGVPNGRILDNYRLLAGAGKAYIVRIPLIAGVNTEAADMAGMAGFIRSLPGKKPKINLLPYHDIGRGKYEKLGKDYRLPDSGLLTPTDALLKRSIEIFHSYGLEAETGA